jgi:hypothetical protein
LGLRSREFIGVLCWESGLVPKGLDQLEKLPGNSTNLSTYDCPIVFRRVDGAATKTILESPDSMVYEKMLRATDDLYARGAVAITTSHRVTATTLRDGITRYGT